MNTQSSAHAPCCSYAGLTAHPTHSRRHAAPQQQPCQRPSLSGSRQGTWHTQAGHQRWAVKARAAGVGASMPFDGDIDGAKRNADEDRGTLYSTADAEQPESSSYAPAQTAAFGMEQPQSDADMRPTASAAAGDTAHRKFDGLSWVMAQEAEVKEEAKMEEGAAARQAWLAAAGRVAASEAQVAVDEDANERLPYHSRLLKAAQAGMSDKAEDILEEMEDAGLMPGPRAYHGLICAYVKAGDANNALDAIRREYNAGVQPLSESYAVLIYALCCEGRTAEAEAVYASLARAGVDKRRGWLMLCNQLYQRELPQVAGRYVAQGVEERLQPDAALYEHMIAQEPLWSRKKEIMVDMKSAGVPPEPRHFNQVVRAMALEGMLEDAMKLVTEIQYDPELPYQPDTDSFNALLEGYIKNGGEGGALRDEEDDAVSNEDWVAAIKGRMAQAGLKPNLRSWALSVQASLEDNNLQDALESFRMLVARAGARRGATKMVPPEALVRLLLQLGGEREGRPQDMVTVLRAIQADGGQLPPATSVPNDKGLTLAASWLPQRLTRLRARVLRPTDGLQAAAQAAAEAEDEVMEVNGVRIGVGFCAVDEEGLIIPPSKMKMDQLAAELTARGLPATGKRTELYKRVQNVRKAAPPEVQAAMRRKAGRAGKEPAAKRGKAAADAATADAAAAADGAAEGAAEGEVAEQGAATGADAPAKAAKEAALSDEADVGLFMHTYQDGILVSKEATQDAAVMNILKKVEEGGGEEGPADEAANRFGDEDDEGKASASDLDDSARGELEEGDIEEEFQRVLRNTTPGSVASASRQVARARRQARSDNEEAGVEVALEMSRMLRAMGCAPNVADLRAMAKAAEAEINGEAAREVAGLGVELVDEADIETLREVFTTCVEVCLQADRADLAEEVVGDMAQAGCEPEVDLETKVSRARAEQRAAAVELRTEFAGSTTNNYNGTGPLVGAPME